MLRLMRLSDDCCMIVTSRNGLPHLLLVTPTGEMPDGPISKVRRNLLYLAPI